MESFLRSPRRNTFLSSAANGDREGVTDAELRRSERGIELRDLSESPKSARAGGGGGAGSSRSGVAGDDVSATAMSSAQSVASFRATSNLAGGVGAGSRHVASSRHIGPHGGSASIHGTAWTPRLDANYANGDVMSALSRQYMNISHDLQSLLDAQSDGLMKALGGGPAEPVAASPSSSPSAGRPASGASRRSQLQTPGSPLSNRRPSSSAAGSAHSRASVYQDDPLDSRNNLVGSSMSASLARQSKSRLLRVDKGTTIPVRQPPKPKPPTLKQARAGILSRLEALQQLKGQESQFYGAARENAEGALHGLVEMRTKRQALVSSMDRAETEGIKRAHEERELADDEKQIETEIGALERRLEDLRAELRFKQQERQALRSEREAEVSSYRNALNELDGRIKREVLSEEGRYAGGKEGRRRRRKEKMETEEQQRKRQQQQGGASSSIAGTSGEGDSNDVAETHVNVWLLPESRRTIDMVIDTVESEAATAREHESAAAAERQACLDGHDAWAAAVSIVEDLEAQLGRAIHAFNRGQQRSQQRSRDPYKQSSQPSSPARPTDPEDPSQIMHAFFRALDAGTAQLHASLSEAERRGWSLLQVAIASELEALRVARDLLGDTLVASSAWSRDDEELEARELAQSVHMGMGSGMGTGTGSPMIDERASNSAQMDASQRTVRPDTGTSSTNRMQKGKSAERHAERHSRQHSRQLSSSSATHGADRGFARYRDESDDDGGQADLLVGDDVNEARRVDGGHDQFENQMLTSQFIGADSHAELLQAAPADEVEHDGPDPTVLFGA